MRLLFVTPFVAGRATFCQGSRGLSALSKAPVEQYRSRRGLVTRCVATNAQAMKTNEFGSSGQQWTEVCLGTMTWGVQNTEEEAHQQLDYAIKERGVNCIDTAEVYPVPSSTPGWTPGLSEDYIGTWLAANPTLREGLHIATKVCGFVPSSIVPRNRYEPPREESMPSRLDRQSVIDACEGSLRRLQTTYIDLFQLHWPDRYVPSFGQREYKLQLERKSVDIKDTASGIKELLDAGKIKAYGISNETPFGTMKWLQVAEQLGMPAPASIQNHFSLLDRSFEGGLAEVCAPSNGNVALLPWSVLSGGYLTGKYIEGSGWDSSELAQSRGVLFPEFMGRFGRPRCVRAIKRYGALAKENNMSLATLAQAFCKTRWFIPSTIIGATSLKQLKENIDAFSVELDDKLLAKIDEIHEDSMDPTLSL